MNHYLQEHGFKILHMGTESAQYGPDLFSQHTAVVLGAVKHIQIERWVKKQKAAEAAGEPLNVFDSFGN